MIDDTHKDRDITVNLHRGSETSVAAHKSVSDQHRYRQKAEIVGWFAARLSVGMTCDEVEVESKLTHQTASARISELLRDGVLRDTGLRRKTRSGRLARVLKLADDTK